MMSFEKIASVQILCLAKETQVKNADTQTLQVSLSCSPLFCFSYKAALSQQCSPLLPHKKLKLLLEKAFLIL